MPTNHAPSIWRVLLAAVVAVAAGVSVLACGSSSASTAASTEPVVHSFVGSFAQQPALKVALLVGRDSSVAYLCDNHGGGVLLHGSARQSGSGGTATLAADDGTALNASFGARAATGTVTLPGGAVARFTAQLAKGSAGLYEAGATTAKGLLQGRWIVGDDGQVAGLVRLNTHPVANPALATTVQVGTTTFTPVLVHQLPVPQAQPRPPLPPAPTSAPGTIAGRVILDRSPSIDSAYSLPCGEFHVRGSGFDPGAPVEVSVVEQYPASPHDNGPLADQNVTVQSDGSIASDLAFNPTYLPGVPGSGYDVAARAIEYPGNASMERVADLGAHAC